MKTGQSSTQIVGNITPPSFNPPTPPIHPTPTPTPTPWVRYHNDNIVATLPIIVKIINV